MSYAENYNWGTYKFRLVYKLNVNVDRFKGKYWEYHEIYR
jgi:hypothetical protein